MLARVALPILVLVFFQPVRAEAAKGFWNACLSFIGLGEPDLPEAELKEWRRSVEDVIGDGDARAMIGRATAHLAGLEHLVAPAKASLMRGLMVQVLIKQFRLGWKFAFHEYDGGWIAYGRADRMIRIGRDGTVYRVDKVPPELFRPEEEERYTPASAEYLTRVARGVTWKTISPRRESNPPTER